MVLSNEQLLCWKENGFIILNNFFSNSRVDKINSYVDNCWKHQSRRSSQGQLVIDVFVGTPKEKRIYFKDAPIEARSHPYKLNDIYLESQEIRREIIDDNLAKVLVQLLKGRPVVINTLSLEFGSEQVFHTDSLYMTPPKNLNMVATWLALEDVCESAGPLKYYPGSHKIKPFLFSSKRMTAIPSEMENYRSYMNDQIEKNRLEEQIFLPKKGDILIWHSQLYHGGSFIKKKNKTRKSIVTHYFKEGDFQGLTPPINNSCLFLKRPPQIVGDL